MRVDEDIATISYDASVRALSSQEAQLAGLHARASFLLAAAGIATGTVLGSTGGGLSRSGLVSVILFGAAAVAATAIIFPSRKVWRFTSNASTIIDAAETHTLSKVQVLEWLAKQNQENYGLNESRLDGRYKLLAGGCILLVLAIVAAVIHLAP